MIKNEDSFCLQTRIPIKVGFFLLAGCRVIKVGYIPHMENIHMYIEENIKVPFQKKKLCVLF